MAKLSLEKELHEYVINHGVREHEILKQLRLHTATLNNAHMQIAPEQGALMVLLGKLLNAKRYLEIGVFTGYSTLNMALNMGEDSYVLAIDKNENHLSIAKDFFAKANVDKNINIQCGNGVEILQNLLSNNVELFDIALIDANKNDYINYYTFCKKLVRSGGLILIDNVLMHGMVLQETPAKKKYMNIIKELNQIVHNDNEVDICMLGISDGMTIVRKKG